MQMQKARAVAAGSAGRPKDGPGHPLPLLRAGGRMAGFGPPPRGRCPAARSGRHLAAAGVHIQICDGSAVPASTGGGLGEDAARLEYAPSSLHGSEISSPAPHDD